MRDILEIIVPFKKGLEQQMYEYEHLHSFLNCLSNHEPHRVLGITQDEYEHWCKTQSDRDMKKALGYDTNSDLGCYGLMEWIEKLVIPSLGHDVHSIEISNYLFMLLKVGLEKENALLFDPSYFVMRKNGPFIRVDKDYLFYKKTTPRLMGDLRKRLPSIPHQDWAHLSFDIDVPIGQSLTIRDLEKMIYPESNYKELTIEKIIQLSKNYYIGIQMQHRQISLMEHNNPFVNILNFVYADKLEQASQNYLQIAKSMNFGFAL